MSEVKRWGAVESIAAAAARFERETESADDHETAVAAYRLLGSIEAAVFMATGRGIEEFDGGLGTAV